MLELARNLIAVSTLGLCSFSVAAQSAPPWGALLPEPSEDAILHAKSLAIEALVQQGLGQVEADLSCGNAFRYIRDPASFSDFMPSGVGHSTGCFAYGVNGHAMNAVDQLAQLAGYQEAYFFVAFPVSNPSMVAPILISAIDGCCVVPYQAGMNPGQLSGAAISTSPASSLSLDFAGAQSAHAATFLLVASHATAPLALSFGYLHVHPSAILAVLPVGLLGGGQLSLVIPNNPSLSGAILYLQGAFVDAAPGAVEPKRLTNGLIVTIQ